MYTFLTHKKNYAFRRMAGRMAVFFPSLFRVGIDPFPFLAKIIPNLLKAPENKSACSFGICEESYKVNGFGFLYKMENTNEQEFCK